MKRIVAVAALVAVLVPFGIPAKAEESPDTAKNIKMYVKAARKELQRRNVVGARQYLMRAHKLDKENFDVHFVMGLSFYIDENRGGLMKWMLGALKLKPKHQQANYYIGRSELELEHLPKAVKYLKAAKTAPEGHFSEPQMQIMVPFSYGVALVKSGKAKDGVKILQELADGGKFESFATRKDMLQRIYYEGYQFTGEAYTALGLFAEADKYLSQMAANHKQLFEGKWANDELRSSYMMNKHRVLISNQGQIQDDVFLNPKRKLKIRKLKGWDFVFFHPECFDGSRYKDPDAAYKNISQAACAAVWRIRKDKERVYKAEVEITVDAWDLKTNLSIAGESVSLSNPKDVARTKLTLFKQDFEPFIFRKLRIGMPAVRKDKLNRKYRAAWFKGCFERKEHREDQRDYEFWCFVGIEYSYFLTIMGKHGIFKEYRKEIEMIKRSIELVK